MKVSASLKKELRQIHSVLSNQFGASQVILFGSHAYGNAGLDSDLDICVVLDLAGKRKIEWMREIRRALTNIVTSPLDILVYAPDEFQHRAGLESTLEHKISIQGIRLNEQLQHSQRVV